ncbi:conserved hypothetical protein, secreted, partial [sediment metagenome]
MKRIIILCFAVFMVCAGCAAFQKPSDQTTPPKQEGFNQSFHGFPDVPIPKELNIVNERSFVYETPSFKAGVIVLTGNVDVASLEN